MDGANDTSSAGAPAQGTELPEEQRWSGTFTALRQLLLDFIAGDACEMDIQQGDLRLHARKGVRQPHVQAQQPAVAPEPAIPGLSIISPLTGVVYLSPSPQAPPYVAVGDVVQVGRIIALVEAMKVFNEIRSEHAGCVTLILVASGDLVQKGQPILELAE